MQWQVLGAESQQRFIRASLALAFQRHMDLLLMAKKQDIREHAESLQGWVGALANDLQLAENLFVVEKRRRIKQRTSLQQ